MPRAHIHQLTNELKALAEKNWDDLEILRGIATELVYRRRQRAKNLRENISVRILELEQPNDSFAWPSTEADQGDGILDGNVFKHSVGLLRYMDYKVGVNGYEEDDRREILERIYEERLPSVNSPAYMAEWGTARTSERLQKMAEAIASFVRNAKRQSHNDMSMAIGEWESDLAFLKKKYYKGTYDFPWPRT